VVSRVLGQQAPATTGRFFYRSVILGTSLSTKSFRILLLQFSVLPARSDASS
jgi:hypothetical protein